MSRLHRFYIPNSWIFITCVTHERLPYLSAGFRIEHFWQVLRTVQHIHPFHLFAYVILPDHFHWVMQTAGDNPNYSAILHSIKRNYTLELKRSEGIISPLKVWQARFWDHIIRDENDFAKHFDYIHYNPVKHGYVDEPGLFEHSSYSFWYSKGDIPENWAKNARPISINDMDLE